MKSKKNTILIALLILSTLLSIASLTMRNTRGKSNFLPQPDPPNENIYWNFDNNTLVGWNMGIYNGSELIFQSDLIFNISATKFYKNYSGMNRDYYGIELTSLYFNTTTNSLEVIIDEYSGAPLIFNHSLVNFTWGFNYGDFMGIDFSSPYGNPMTMLYVNPFIPMNGSDGLLLEWCANRLIEEYSYFLSYDSDPTIYNNPSMNTTRVEENDLGTGEYVETTYYANGTLKSATIKTTQGTMGPNYITYNYTRIFDFNPLDDLEWSLDVGDIFYIGMSGNEFQYNITGFINNTYSTWMGGKVAAQEVKANISVWNYFGKSWDFFDDNVTIGWANEENPIVLEALMGGEEKGNFPFIVPNGTTGEELARSFAMLKTFFPEVEITYGDYWSNLVNTTTGEDAFTKYFPNGLVKYIYSRGCMIPEDMVIFYKNSTIISGDYDFEIETYGTNEFDAHVNITVSDNSHLLFAGMHLNPTNITLDNGLLFIDLFLNDTSNLGGLVNITINYNPNKYGYVKLWYFNISMNDGKGAWEEISFIYVDTDTIMVSVDHLSFFALSGVPYPGAFALYEDADDPDTDGEFKLWWDSSSNANSYSIYKSNSSISILTGSETLVKSGIVGLTENIAESVNGTYYYIVVAINEAGQALSNCVEVKIELSVEPEPKPPGNFTLSSNAGTPDDDGDFTLSWIASTGADNYTIYQYSGPITVINDSLTVLAEEVTSRTRDLTGYADGAYYFIVVAHNEIGDTLSNYIIVEVDIEPGDGKPPIPGYDLYLLLILFTSLTAILVIKKRKKF